MSKLQRCPQCDAEIPVNSPAGLCPRCLLKVSADSQSEKWEGEASAEPAPTTPTPPTSGFIPPSVEELSPLFPQLEILALLGKGGMGAVYKARQPGLDRLVALKILPPEISSDPAFAERFQREARALARLSHPHIVTVYDFGTTDSARRGEARARRGSPDPAAGQTEGLPPSGEPQETFGRMGGSVGDRPQRAGALCYIMMEFVDGANLRQTIRAGKLAPAEALAIVPQICEALQFAHDEGIVHRDIKPENILIDKRGRVKIADFGLAKLMASGERESPDRLLTATHQVMGTLRYMAPEQMQGSREVDHRADIYSLGVVFYELLTGELPMGRFAPPSKKVQLDVRLDEIVLRALEQDPERRYQHASEVKTEIEIISRAATATQSESAASGQLPPNGWYYGLWGARGPQYENWVRDRLLLWLPIWLVLAVIALVLGALTGNLNEPLLGMVLGSFLVVFPLWLLLRQDRKTRRGTETGTANETNIGAWSSVEMATAAVVAIAFVLAAVKGIFELAQRPSPLDNVAVFVTAIATIATAALLGLHQFRQTDCARVGMPGLFIAILAASAGSLPWTAVFSPIAGWLFWQGAVFASLNFLLGLFLLMTGNSYPRTQGIVTLLVGLVGFALVIWFDIGPVGVIGSDFLSNITRKPGLPGEFIAAALALLAMIAGALQVRRQMTADHSARPAPDEPRRQPDSPVGVVAIEPGFAMPTKADSRPKLVPVLATFNLIGAILLMLVCAMEEPAAFVKPQPPLWQMWEKVDAVLGFSMAAGMFAASIGLFLWKPWARKLTLGVCIYGLASFVFDAPYLARSALPEIYADIQQTVIDEGIEPEARDFVALFTIVVLFGGMLVVGLTWLIGQLVYFTRPRVVAAFESQGEKYGKFVEWLFTGAGAVVGVLGVFGPLALLLGIAAMMKTEDGANAPPLKQSSDGPGSSEKTDPPAAYGSIHQAAAAGDVARLKQLLDAGASLNAKDADGQTPMMKAVAGGHKSLALTLILLGADLAEQDQRGRSALMIAAEKRDATFLSRLKELSQMSYDSDATKRQERLRAFAGIEPSLLAGRDVDLLYFSPYPAERLKDADGENALMKAARSGDWECFNLLATQLATMQAQDKLGRTPLMHAVLGGQAGQSRWKEQIEWLTKPPYFGIAGVDNIYVGAMFIFELEGSLSVLDNDGKSVVQLAEQHQQSEVARILRRHLEMIITNQTAEIEKGGESAAKHLRLRALAWQALGEIEKSEVDYKKALPE